MIPSPLDGKSYDVIVAGAGSAGIAAACSAARAGARTLLLERHGYGGGILTAAMIHTFDAIKSCADHDVEVVAGFARELLTEISALGGDATADNPSEALTIHPEIYKVAIDRLLARAGVDVLYHAHVCDALLDKSRVSGVEAALRDGRARFRAPVVVDGTGDAEIAFYAGAAFDLAPDLQALTCHFRLGNVAPGHTWRDWEEITRRALQAAHAAGEITKSRSTRRVSMAIPSMPRRSPPPNRKAVRKCCRSGTSCAGARRSWRTATSFRAPRSSTFARAGSSAATTC